MESGEVPMIGTPAASRSRASFSGVWPPYCTMTPSGCSVDDLQHVLERQRLEVEAVGGVVVGGDGLRVAVDHDGLVAVLAHGEGGVHAAVVELDALADAVRAAAEDHDLRRRTAPASHSSS
jgi:glycosyltransferase involved in cell wall biosynthesis